MRLMIFQPSGQVGVDAGGQRGGDAGAQDEPVAGALGLSGGLA